MKEIKSFLLSILLLSFILFSFSLTGCQEKKEDTPLIAIENTTEIFTQKDKDKIAEKKLQKRLMITKADHSKKPSSSQIETDTFILKNIQQMKHTLTIRNQKVNFHDIDQAIVIVHFFTTWYSPCCGEIPYLSDLQKKYKKKVFISGILVNDTQSEDTLNKFIHKYHADYFISNSKQNDIFAAKVVKDLHLPKNFPIPLTVIYVEGNYYTHYEGAVPIEMIEHDIRQAIKTKGL